MPKQIHIISTGKQSITELTSIVSEIHPYMDVLHIREKNMGAQDLYHLVKQLENGGVPLSKIVINDRVDVAVATGVKGVQLGFRSLNVDVVKKTFPQLTVGCSVHSVEEALEKQAMGADFVVFGHIYETLSKLGLQPRGIESLRELVSILSIPVIAIGGINVHHVPELLQTNVTGIAMMSGILQADYPLLKIKQFSQLLHENKQPGEGATWNYK